ncbi:hypothetical protein [uncultured Sphingomonas sp.]|uniref:hypothetical protein n=1 Tax=uncultured Sphingomonas sp. TaxID=158754 RepID=UPI002591C9C6|nr:hypothetical protein [uncultured Sphingomonas sp.]
MNTLIETPKQYLKRAFLALVGSIGEDLKTLVMSVAGIVAALLAIPSLPFALVYFLFIQGHSNCLFWAVGEKLRSWRVVDIIRVKNSRGRSHWQIKVRQTGAIYEFYSKGAAQRSRVRNLWYKGHMRLVGGGK